MNRTKKDLEKSIKESICFGIHRNNKLVGFFRVVTDKTFFSWITDLVLEEEYKKADVGQLLIECTLEHPEIKNTKFTLATPDAKENQFMTIGKNQIDIQYLKQILLRSRPDG